MGVDWNSERARQFSAGPDDSCPVEFAPPDDSVDGRLAAGCGTEDVRAPGTLVHSLDQPIKKAPLKLTSEPLHKQKV
jgi:hypothetical protein